MKKFQLILQTFFFCVFFACGIASISVSVLSEELMDYYFNKAYLAETQNKIERAKELCMRYDEQIALIHEQPEVLARLKKVQLGQALESNDEVLYPALNSELNVDSRAVVEQIRRTNVNNQKTPFWLEKLGDGKKRFYLFGLGVVLVFVSFICFSGPVLESPDSKEPLDL